MDVMVYLLRKGHVPIIFREHGPIFIYVGLLLLVLTGCSSTEQLRTPSGKKVTTAHLKKRFQAFYHRWEGTPYRYGGNSRKGMDCSAFVQRLYLETLGIRIPRTTGQQWRIGVPISRERLQTGDLVFFRTSEDGLHVGVYMEKARFIHASTSRGVTTSLLTHTYWSRRFIGARRVLTEEIETIPPQNGSKRIASGW